MKIENYFPSKLGQNIMLWIGILLICVIAGTGFLVFRSERNILVSRSSEKANMINKIVLSAFYVYMPAGHIEELHKYYKKIRNIGNILEIKVIHGQAIHKQFGAKNFEKPNGALEIKSLQGKKIETIEKTKSGRIFRKISPIKIERYCLKCHKAKIGEIAGALSIKISLNTIDELIIQRHIYLAILTLLTMLIIIVTLYTLINFKVITPISKLAIATKELAKGNLDIKVDIKSNDEIGILAKSFNQMTLDLKKSQENLIRAEKLATVGEIASGIAHEIGNPISSVKCFIQLLKEEEKKGGKIKFTEEMLEEINRASKIVRDMLDFAKPQKMKQEPINLNFVLEDSIKIISLQSEFENITVKTNFTNNLPEIIANKDSLKQIFVNIILNSVQSMYEGGELEITTTYAEKEKKIIVSIQDTGCGIAPENLNKVFEPFFTTKEKGSGLGLTVCKSIIKSYGGNILLESEKGKGSTFTIIFPVVR